MTTLLVTAATAVTLSACSGDEEVGAGSPAETSRSTTAAPSTGSEPAPDGSVLPEYSTEQEAALVAELEARGFIPAVADEAVAVILGESVCTRYGLGDDYPAVISTLARTGMPVERAAQLEEVATSTICPEHAARY